MAQRPGWGPRRLKTLASCDRIGIFQRRRAGPPMRSGGWQSYVPRGCGKGNPGHLRLSGQGPLPYPQGHPRALARWAFQHGRLPVEQDDVPERVFQQDGIVGQINKHQSDILQSWTHPTRWQMRRQGHGGRGRPEICLTQADLKWASPIWLLTSSTQRQNLSVGKVSVQL